MKLLQLWGLVLKSTNILENTQLYTLNKFRPCKQTLISAGNNRKKSEFETDFGNLNSCNCILLRIAGNAVASYLLVCFHTKDAILAPSIQKPHIYLPKNKTQESEAQRVMGISLSIYIKHASCIFISFLNINKRRDALPLKEILNLFTRLCSNPQVMI